MCSSAGLPACRMFRFLRALIARFDAVYAEAAHFSRLKARLLAAFAVLLCAWVPVNVVKIIWVQPPYFEVRLAMNACILLAALIGVWWAARGKVQQAGNGMALGLILPTHATLLLVP